MPLNLIKEGESQKVRRVIGKADLQRFLRNLGFVEGERITVVSMLGESLIVMVKGTRIALDSAVAGKILV